jgi:hypothetical protein
MIARVDGEVETESEGDDVEYPVEGVSKKMTWNNKGRTFFILDGTSTRYVV